MGASIFGRNAEWTFWRTTVAVTFASVKTADCSSSRLEMRIPAAGRLHSAKPHSPPVRQSRSDVTCFVS